MRIRIKKQRQKLLIHSVRFTMAAALLASGCSLLSGCGKEEKKAEKKEKTQETVSEERFADNDTKLLKYASDRYDGRTNAILLDVTNDGHKELLVYGDEQWKHPEATDVSTYIKIFTYDGKKVSELDELASVSEESESGGSARAYVYEEDGVNYIVEETGDYIAPIDDSTYGTVRIQVYNYEENKKNVIKEKSFTRRDESQKWTSELMQKWDEYADTVKGYITGSRECLFDTAGLYMWDIAAEAQPSAADTNLQELCYANGLTEQKEYIQKLAQDMDESEGISNKSYKVTCNVENLSDSETYDLTFAGDPGGLFGTDVDDYDKDGVPEVFAARCRIIDRDPEDKSTSMTGNYMEIYFEMYELQDSQLQLVSSKKMMESGGYSDTNVDIFKWQTDGQWNLGCEVSGIDMIYEGNTELIGYVAYAGTSFSEEVFFERGGSWIDEDMIASDNQELADIGIVLAKPLPYQALNGEETCMLTEQNPEYIRLFGRRMTQSCVEHTYEFLDGQYAIDGESGVYGVYEYYKGTQLPEVKEDTGKVIVDYRAFYRKIMESPSEYFEIQDTELTFILTDLDADGIPELLGYNRIGSHQLCELALIATVKDDQYRYYSDEQLQTSGDIFDSEKPVYPYYRDGKLVWLSNMEVLREGLAVGQDYNYMQTVSEMKFNLPAYSNHVIWEAGSAEYDLLTQAQYNDWMQIQNQYTKAEDYPYVRRDAVSGIGDGNSISVKEYDEDGNFISAALLQESMTIDEMFRSYKEGKSVWQVWGLLQLKLVQ